MSDWVQIAGWVLLHFLWQGSILAVLAAAALRFCRLGSSTARYLAACIALGAMLAAPIVTAFALASNGAAAISSSALVAAASRIPEGHTFEFVREGQHMLEGTVRGATLEAYFPVMVSVWMAGVAVLLLQTFRNWYQIRRLQKTALAWTPSSWQVSADRLAQRLGLRTPARVAELPVVEVPTVLGWLQPVIILPVSAVAQLSTAQVEAILAHELAHVRRHDYLVNLFQRVAEAALFYHPAIWWISARVREEREHCCDDLAVALCGDRDDYASALAELESRRTSPYGVGLAATDGPLLKRIRRILQLNGADRIRTPNWAITLGLVGMFALVLGGPQRSPALLAEGMNRVAEAVIPSFSAGWRGAMGSGSLASSGTVVFADDLRDVRSVSDGGFLAIQADGLFSSRRIEIRAAGGALYRTYYVNDVEQPWSDDARRWFAEHLPFLVRRSGVAANERVQQIAKAHGVDAVLAEIKLLESDAVRGRYFRALLETLGVNPAEVEAALMLAATIVDSSMELGSILRTAVTAGYYDSNSFFYAAHRLSSSAEKSDLLVGLLEKGRLSRARQVDFLSVAATIESNSECAGVLDAFLTRYPIAEEPVRAAFLAALDTVDSRVEQEHLRQKLPAGMRP